MQTLVERARKKLPLLCLALCTMLVTGCAGLKENLDQSRQEHLVPGKQIHLTGMRGYRFCEVGLITGTSKSNAVANIWNTTGACDPTPEQFAALDAEKLAKETDSRKVWLNPVRHWMFDEFWCFEAGDDRAFGDIRATWMGVVGAEAIMKATVKGSFYPGYIYRDSKFKYNRGSEVYLLDAPDGEVFILQSYTDHWDKSLTEAGLKDLGGKLELPSGWKFRAKVLDRDLEVSQIKHDMLAHVLQDNLHNTYQGADGGKAFSYIP